MRGRRHGSQEMGVGMSEEYISSIVSVVIINLLSRAAYHRSLNLLIH